MNAKNLFFLQQRERTSRIYVKYGLNGPLKEFRALDTFYSKISSLHT